MYHPTHHGDPQQEYAEALAAYREALARLQEAKRHIPLSPQDRWRQRRREKREAARAHYLANKEQIDAQNAEMINGITAKALAILHQKLNFANALDSIQPTRIRLPVTYTVSTGKDDE